MNTFFSGSRRRNMLALAASLALVITLAFSAVLLGAPKSSHAAGAQTTKGRLAYVELSGGEFGIMDLATGGFSSLGNNGGLTCLMETGGTLYGESGATLYQVNPKDGSLTSVGSGSTSFVDCGSTTTGLFALDYGMNLYSIDPTSGASTFIGSTGLSLPDHNGMSTGASALYYILQVGTSSPILYTLDTSGGGATPVGSTPAVFGPAFINGTLYAESWTTSCTDNPSGVCAQSIYTINPTTGIFAPNVTTPLHAISDGAVDALLWGVDSSEHITQSFYDQVKATYGVPDFWGRYIGLSSLSKHMTIHEVNVATALGLAIMPIYADFIKSVKTAAEGTKYAQRAITAALFLGIDPGVAIFLNIEPQGDGVHPTSEFLKAWYDQFQSGFDYTYQGQTYHYIAGDYIAGYYGDSTDQNTEFDTAYCEAVTAEPQIATNSYIWSQQHPDLGVSSRLKSPGFAPDTPPCLSQTVAWQYGTSTHVDTDEALLTLPLWRP